MKRLWIALGVVLAAVVVVAVLFYSSLDAIVKAAIEKVGSDVTGTRVRVADVSISPASGTGRLRGFHVTNPEGFESDDAFQFDEISLKIDIATLASDPVVIEELVVQGPRIRYEFGGRGTNVGEIQQNAERYSAGPDPAEGPNFVIKHLYFRDGKVNVAGGRVMQKGLTVPLPDVHMTDIGTAEGGATPAAVAKQVVQALGHKVAAATASLNLDQVAHKTGEAVKDGAEQTKDAAKSAGRKLKGLFK